MFYWLLKIVYLDYTPVCKIKEKENIPKRCLSERLEDDNLKINVLTIIFMCKFQIINRV